MTIVCATDFSEPAARAGTVAAILSARSREPMALLFAAEPTSTFDPAASILGSARERGAAEAERLGKLGATVETRFVAGVPDEVIVDEVEKRGARLVVIGSLGRRTGSRWRLGSTADRTAQTSPVPVLVVRSSEPFEAWSDSRPLRVVVGVDFSVMTDSVLAWTRWLCRTGPCEVILAHVYFPPGERHRLRVKDVPTDIGGVHPEIEASLVKDLGERIGDVPAQSVTIRPIPGLGNTGERLVEFARQERADLVVVGAHQRGFLGRLWHGSVSETVLEQASANVACVPERAAEIVKERVPEVRIVLAATDFSRAGNAAILHAYAVLPAGGKVHIAHVAHPGCDKPALEATLRGLVPREAQARHIETEVHVIESTAPADALVNAAERCGAALVVLGLKPRSGVVKAIVGSVAEGVMNTCPRPVLLVRA